MSEAKCAICLEDLVRPSIFLINPCGHFLCEGCSKELTIRWKNRNSRRKCPSCRGLLDSRNSIIKPHSYSICNSVNSSLFFWVPKNLIFRGTVARQNLITFLEEKNFKSAFKLCFLLDIEPDDQQELVCPGWKDKYISLCLSLSCVLCNCQLFLDDCFVSRCGHFYCTVCASFTLYSRSMTMESGDIPCNDCGRVLKDHPSDYGLIRPMKQETTMVDID